MSKGTKEMLKTLISNTELIMQHLKIKKVESVEKSAPKKTARKKSTKRTAEKKSPGKKR
ncbi:MAG: hypothetical protein Q8L81_18575 [Bacteroidota bacterium]|nr:hypothetical protein [Bacteroidota bacterium]